MQKKEYPVTHAASLLPFLLEQVRGQSRNNIKSLLTRGQVQVDGQIWTARSAHGVVIPAGSRVKVLSIQGVKVMVELA